MCLCDLGLKSTPWYQIKPLRHGPFVLFLTGNSRQSVTGARVPGTFIRWLLVPGKHFADVLILEFGRIKSFYGIRY